MGDVHRTPFRAALPIRRDHRRADVRVRYVDHVRGRGVDLFRAACEHDLEGIVAKWRDGTYQTGPPTSWLKIRNPEYTQWDGRRDLFEPDETTPAVTVGPGPNLPSCSADGSSFS